MLSCKFPLKGFFTPCAHVPPGSFPLFSCEDKWLLPSCSFPSRITFWSTFALVIVISNHHRKVVRCKVLHSHPTTTQLAFDPHVTTRCRRLIVLWQPPRVSAVTDYRYSQRNTPRYTAPTTYKFHHDRNSGRCPRCFSSVRITIRKRRLIRPTTPRTRTSRRGP